MNIALTSRGNGKDYQVAITIDNPNTVLTNVELAGHVMQRMLETLIRNIDKDAAAIKQPANTKAI